MAGLRALFTISISLLLSHTSLARNEAPCQRSKWNNGYDKFVSRHIRSGTPNSLDYNEWNKYIMNNGGCDRPTQSFLRPSDLERLNAICTSQGGKTYKDNLCISAQPFSFVTVRSEPGTCGIRSVREESKHVIVACEVLENQKCLPVHFEGNPEGKKPSNNAKGCQESQKGQATSLRPTWQKLLLAILVLINYAL